MKNIWNRIWNTAMIVPRTVGTGLNTVTEVVDTSAALIKDTLDVGGNTIHKAKNVFVDARTKWKWYQRVWNIALSPIVAAGTVLEWAVRTAVTPVAHWVVNVWNTAKNTVTNARKSTFGRIFSKRPLSDFSYDKLKTANFINKDKNRFSWLQFGKKKWVWTPEALSASSKATAAAAATAATAATAAAVSSKESSTAMDDVMKKFEKKLKDMEDSFSKKMEEVLAANRKLNEQNKKLIEDNKNKDWEIAKLKAEIEWLKKPAESKPAEKPAEKKWDGWKVEKKEEKPESKEIKDEKRVPEIIKSSKSKKMLNYLQRTHPEIKIKTDNTTWKWKLLWSKSWNMIIIWTKDRENAEHITDHEIAHVMYRDNVAWMQELEGAVRALNDRYGKQLSSVANNDDEYKTKTDKTIEDVCEIIAFYARDDGSFEKHMKKLQSGEDKTLAKISESDAEHLKSLCENIISNLNTEAKTVKMFEPVSAAA